MAALPSATICAETVADLWVKCLFAHREWAPAFALEEVSVGLSGQPGEGAFLLPASPDVSDPGPWLGQHDRRRSGQLVPSDAPPAPGPSAEGQGPGRYWGCAPFFSLFSHGVYLLCVQVAAFPGETQ